MKIRSCALAILLGSLSAASAATVTFEELFLSPNSAENGANLTPYTTGTAFGSVENYNRFSSGGINFENRYIPDFASWSRWAYSNQTNTTTPGFTNDLSAFTGGGASSTGTTVPGQNYAVSFQATNPIDLGPAPGQLLSIMVTNTTYPALSMRDGDPFAKQFGGATGNDPDFFKLAIEGLDGTGTGTGMTEVYLADFRFSDNAMDYVLDSWLEVDLSGFGANTRSLNFALSSSDNGAFGMNTPAYFAIDNLIIAPEPAGLFLFTLSGLLLVFPRRKRK
jgi:hypothetical protein